MINRFVSRTLAGTLIAASLFSGCGDSDNFVFTNTSNNPTPPGPVLQAPVAVNDSFAALGNATLNQAATGVLANDTLNGATITSFDATGSNGGTLNLNADGSFTYTPALNFVGAETFDYTLTNSLGSSTATVTLTSTGLGRFVDNSGANGTGTQASPFNNLQDALNAAQNGDTIYVARGDGTNTGVPGGFTLPAGVKLVGEGTGLILAQTIEPAGTAPVISGPITCLGNNLIQGFTIDGSTGNGVIIDGVPNVTIASNTFSDSDDRHIDCMDVTGTVTIDNNVFADAPTMTSTDYINLDQENSNATFAVTNNTFRNPTSASMDTLVEIYSEGTSVLNATLSDNTALGTADDQFNYGFYWDHEGSAACSAIVNGNNLAEVDDTFEFYASSTAALNLTLTENMLDSCGYPIYGEFSNSTWTISGNVITDGEDEAIYVYNVSDGTVIVTNNSVTNNDDIGFYYETDDSNVDTKIALRNNTFTTTGDNAIDILAEDSNSDVCCDIIGNTVNDDMRFNDNSSGALTVERFGDATGSELKTVNTFNNGATVTVPNDAVVDAIPGFCQIP